MAKKELAIRLLVEENIVNKALVILDQGVLPLDKLNERFFDREPLVLDMETLGEESLSATLAFVALIEDDNQSKEKGG